MKTTKEMNNGVSNSAWPYANSYAYMQRVKQGMPPVIIVCACNGGVQGKEYNQNIPEMPDEIADSVYEAYKAGAAMVHVHARDPDNITRSARTPEAWYEVNKKIRERCPDIIINNTTGGGPDLRDEDRLCCLAAKPEIASLNIAPDMSKFHLKERKAPLRDPRPAIEHDYCHPVSYKQLAHYASEMARRGVKPEVETYHPGGGWIIQDLIEQGLLEKPYWIQTVMNYQSSSFPTLDNALHMVREFPEDTLWLCSGIGSFQLPMTTLATLIGGHVRVGLEDNIYYRRGVKAENNAQLVSRAVRIAHELNRDIATPAEARQMLGLSPTPTNYP
jgi:3-keto-5-aminohexanoate cleavage enzyme